MDAPTKASRLNAKGLDVRSLGQANLFVLQSDVFRFAVPVEPSWGEEVQGDSRGCLRGSALHSDQGPLARGFRQELTRVYRVTYASRLPLTPACVYEWFFSNLHAT